MKFDQFKIKHSEIISYYQFIESDLKTIYCMYNRNLSREKKEALNKYNLGAIILEFENFDKLNSKPLFKREFYVLLNEMRLERNYWCHQVYLDFSYQDDFLESKEYKTVVEKLNKTTDKLIYLHEQIEKIRIKFYEYTKGIR